MITVIRLHLMSYVELFEFIKDTYKAWGAVNQTYSASESGNYYANGVLIGSTLKQINKLPQDPKDLPDAIKTYLIESDKIHASYNDVFKKVLTMRKLLDENKADEIPQRDVELMREYVRRFIRDMAPMLGDAKKEINEKQERKKQ